MLYLSKYKSVIFLVLCIAILGSCKKTLDINNNPNDPTTISVSRLLPTAERNIGDGLAIGSGNNGGLSEILAVYTHQMTTREEQDQYGATGNEFFLGLAWPALYQNALSNLEQIIDDATPAGNTRYSGIAKILKAYTYSQLVDVFGDIPFSEAHRLKEGIRYPKFDDDAAIYPQLFGLLDEGIADLNNATAANAVVPGVDDLIYGGDRTKWIKAANTIKLKLYTQVRKVQNVTTQVTQLLSNPSMLINSTAESFVIPYGPNAATDDRNPGYGDYFATQRSNHISPWFYEILKGYNPTVLTGIRDPRIPYYIYNQLKPTQAPREGNQTEYRDSSFVSIYFGSIGPDRDRTQQNSISLFGIYPVGGRYDDGAGEIATGNSGTGAAPYRMITYADRLYLEAELIQAGVITGTARTVLQAAMQESFKQVDYVITQYVKPAQTVPALNGTAAVTTYINAALAQYDAGDANKKMQMIMTEKWISSFGSSVDQYTDYRRTGYPILFNPTDPVMAPGGQVQPPINGDPVNPGAQKKVPVQLSKTYPFSLPYAQSELESNQNAPEQKNPQTYKVFWMP
jgi:hypothetical protein